MRGPSSSIPPFRDTINTNPKKRQLKPPLPHQERFHIRSGFRVKSLYEEFLDKFELFVVFSFEIFDQPPEAAIHQRKIVESRH